MTPTIEWTFRAGEILTFAGTMIGGLGVAVAFLYRRGGDAAATHLTLERMSTDFSEMKTEFKAFSSTLSKVAIQEMQIGLLMKWYDELRNGKGIIVKDEK